MEYRDKTLACIECQREFVWTAAEQLFYADRGLKNEPKRCRDCKRRKFAPSPKDRFETRTVCSQCGQETVVPFKPKQGRPVYCARCYEQRKTRRPA